MVQATNKTEVEYTLRFTCIRCGGPGSMHATCELPIELADQIGVHLTEEMEKQTCQSCLIQMPFLDYALLEPNGHRYRRNDAGEFESY